MAEREDIKIFTDLFRTSMEGLWVRLRKVVRERGVDPNTSTLVFSVEDDVNFEFGILVTHDRRVIQYGFLYSDPSYIDGRLTEWEDLTERWAASPYRLEVSVGLSVLDEVA